MAIYFITKSRALTDIEIEKERFNSRLGRKVTYNACSEVPKYDRSRKSDDISDPSCKVEEKEEIAHETASQRCAIESQAPRGIGKAYRIFVDARKRWIVIISPGCDQGCEGSATILQQHSL